MRICMCEIYKRHMAWLFLPINYYQNGSRCLKKPANRRHQGEDLALPDGPGRAALLAGRRKDTLAMLMRVLAMDSTASRCWVVTALEMRQWPLVAKALASLLVSLLVSSLALLLVPLLASVLVSSPEPRRKL